MTKRVLSGAAATAVARKKTRLNSVITQPALQVQHPHQLAADGDSTNDALFPPHGDIKVSLNFADSGPRKNTTYMLHKNVLAGASDHFAAFEVGGWPEAVEISLFQDEGLPYFVVITLCTSTMTGWMIDKPNRRMRIIT